jgi:hypothetical protein
LEGEIGEALIGSVKEFDRRRVVTDVAYYFPRFLKLIVVPKRVIRAFSASREEELASALTFLTVSLLIFTAFSVPLFIEKDRMIALLLVQFIMLAMLAFCSSAILQVSWRWVGGTADFSRYLSINSYYWGVSSVLVLCLVISALGVIKVFDPHMLKLLRRAAAGDVAPLIAFHPRKSTPLRVAAWIILIGNLLLPFWTYAFWGAYREINDNTTRLHSFFAFGISSIIFIPVGLLFALMQQGLFNLLR